MVPQEPRALKDPVLLRRRLERLHEPHVAPLNTLVRELRESRGGGETVPWFDPDGGGVNSKTLMLFESPGPRSTAAKGSGIITPDNNDGTASNTFLLRDEAGLRRDELLHWNIVPWYIPAGTKTGKPTEADLAGGARFLQQVLCLLPNLKVIVLVGKFAQDGWKKVPAVAVPTGVWKLPMPHPSPTNLNTRPENREEILRILGRVRALLD